MNQVLLYTIALKIVIYLQALALFSDYPHLPSARWQVTSKWKRQNNNTYETVLKSYNLFHNCKHSNQFLVFPGTFTSHYELEVDGLGVFTNSDFGPGYLSPKAIPLRVRCRTDQVYRATLTITVASLGFATMYEWPSVYSPNIFRTLLHLINIIAPGLFIALAIVGLLSFYGIVRRNIMLLFLAQNLFFFLYFMGMNFVAFEVPVAFSTSSQFLFYGLWMGALCFFKISKELFRRNFPGVKFCSFLIVVCSIVHIFTTGNELGFILILVPGIPAIFTIGCIFSFILKNILTRGYYPGVRIGQLAVLFVTASAGFIDFLGSLGLISGPLTIGTGMFAVQIFFLLEFYIIAKKNQSEKMAIASGLRKTTAEASVYEQRVNTYQSILHDIKSPMGLLKVLVEDTSNPIPRKTADKALRRIQNIFDHSLGQGQLHPTPTDIQLIIDRTQDIIESKELEYISSRSLSFYFEDRPTNSNRPSQQVLCQIDILEEICSNLLNNAAQACQFSGRIELEINQGHDFLEIRIKDSGIGFPQVVVENLGNVGFTYRKNQGSGIGLNQSIATLKKWGGQLTIDSPRDPTIVVIGLRVVQS